MTFLIVIAILGIAAGSFTNSLMETRGADLGLPLSAVAGLVGSFFAGILFLIFGRLLVGEGFDMIVSLFAAVVGAIVTIVLVATVKKRVIM